MKYCHFQHGDLDYCIVQVSQRGEDTTILQLKHNTSELIYEQGQLTDDGKQAMVIVMGKEWADKLGVWDYSYIYHI